MLVVAVLLDQDLGDRVLEVALDRPPQRPRAGRGLDPGVLRAATPSAGVVDLDPQAALGERVVDVLEQDVDDRAQLALRPAG